MVAPPGDAGAPGHKGPVSNGVADPQPTPTAPGNGDRAHRLTGAIINNLSKQTILVQESVTRLTYIIQCTQSFFLKCKRMNQVTFTWVEAQPF